MRQGLLRSRELYQREMLPDVPDLRRGVLRCGQDLAMPRRKRASSDRARALPGPTPAPAPASYRATITIPRAFAPRT